MKNGVLDIEQVKKELFDFHTAIMNVGAVYGEITGGMLSKINYRSEDVIRAYEDHLNDLFKDFLKDECEACPR